MNLLCCCCTMAPNTRVTRKWELFAGRNKFYCDGLLMSAPHTGVFYLTCVLISGTSALFFAYDCPFLATHITPAIPIVGAVLYFFTMSSLLRTTFTDPGVIPRASHDEAAYIEKQIEVPNSLNSPTYRPPPRTKEVLVKGQTVKLKYCFTCKIFRPPRASHCSLCDNCVDRFDHHCPWVGNCVGKRNYRFFYMFLVSLAFLAVFIFSCSVTHLVLLMKTEEEVFEVIKKAPFTVIVVFICFFSIWSVIGLAGFHTYLTTSDQTTNEDLKGSFSSKGGQRTINPYSRGNICLNCCHILCGPMTPSLIDRRGVATDDYILQMQQQSSPRHPLSDVISATQVGSGGGMITNQPMLGGISGAGGGISIGGSELKPRLYDESNPSSSTLGGVYRPRSYDNLQNGNSNSLAHLVDNEIPLSQMDSPQTQPQSGAHHPHARQHQQHLRLQLAAATNKAIEDDDDDIDGHGHGDGTGHGDTDGDIATAASDVANVDDIADVVDDDEVVVVDNSEVIAAVAAIAATHKAAANAKHRNMSGSYSNLFNAVDYDGTTTTPTTPTATSPNGDIIQMLPPAAESKHGRYYKGPQSGLLAAAVAGNLALAEGLSSAAYGEQQQQHHLAKSISQTENMYSNVPSGNATMLAGDNMVVGSPTSAVLASVVAAAAAHNSISPIVESQTHHDPSLHVYSNLIEERQQQLHHHQQQQQQQPHQPQQHSQHQQQPQQQLHQLQTTHGVGNGTSAPTQLSSSLLHDDLDLDDPVSASFVVNSGRKYPATSKAHVKRKMGVAGIVESSAGGGALSPGDGKASSAALNGNADLTPSRLRMLHDTTMIDTALDLDSLDGSSLGNNSQDRLVKQQQQQQQQQHQLHHPIV